MTDKPAKVSSLIITREGKFEPHIDRISHGSRKTRFATGKTLLIVTNSGLLSHFHGNYMYKKKRKSSAPCNNSVQFNTHISLFFNAGEK